MIELTQGQRQAIAASLEPLRLVDPQTKDVYVLLRAEVYERLRPSLEEDFDPQEAYPFVDRVMAEDDANDPTLDSYQS